MIHNCKPGDQISRISRSVLLVACLIPLCALLSPAPPAAADLEEHFTSFPQRPSGTTPQAYRLEYIFFNRDLGGNTKNRIYIMGKYTRGLENGTVCWDSVRIASAPGETEPFSEDSPIESMEGFSYTINQDIIGESFFDRFPQGDIRHLIKTLIWDGAMFEMFETLRNELEMLEPGAPKRAEVFEDFNIQMGEFASLKMKDLSLEWTGTSMMNGERCALVQYRSFSNPVNGIGISGRSLYFGRVWISVEDGEFECLTLNEDVALELPIGEAGKKLVDIQREVRFTKIIN